MLRIVKHLVFAALVVLCVALVILNVEAWRGTLVDNESASGATPSTTAAATRPRAGPRSIAGGQAAQSRDVPASYAATRTMAPSQTASEVSLAVSSTRGPCWLAVRSGSSTGRVLYQGILARGATRSFSGRRLWLELGAAANVDLSLGGEPVRDFGTGTLDLVATRSGVRPAA